MALGYPCWFAYLADVLPDEPAGDRFSPTEQSARPWKVTAVRKAREAHVAKELRDRGGDVPDQAPPAELATIRSIVGTLVVRDAAAMLKETLARLDGFDGTALAEFSPFEVERLAASVDDGIELLHRFRQQLKDAMATHQGKA